MKEIENEDKELYMGYQVGNVCYATKQQAENVYFSLVSPIVLTTTTTGTIFRPSTTSSQLIAPSYKNGKWYLQNQVVTASLPTCDIGQNFRDGAYIGFIVMSIIIVAWGVNFIIKIIQRLM